MAQVRGKNTRPERLVRSLLHRLGYRFTVNGPKNKRLPGKPDIVMPGRKTAIFVHGCFWHRHPGCKHATSPKSNIDYWNAKFRRNVERDRQNQRDLSEMGWKVIVIWECELKTLDRVAARLIADLPRNPELNGPDEIEDERLVAETQAAYRRRAKRTR